MKSLSLRTMILSTPLAIAAAAPVAAQVVQSASGFATVSVAGLGNTTSVAGDSRIPILQRDVSIDTASNTLHVRATGHRGAVRLLLIDVRDPRAGRQYDMSADSGASLHVRMETGPELVAQPGHGNVTISTIDEHRVTGMYEGTFTNGSVPMVVRGHFEASFPRTHAAASSSP